MSSFDTVMSPQCSVLSRITPLFSFCKMHGIAQNIEIARDAVRLALRGHRMTLLFSHFLAFN